MKIHADRLHKNASFLWAYARPYKTHFVGGIMFVLMSTALILLMGNIVQEVLQHLKDNDYVYFEDTIFKAFMLILVTSLTLFGRVLFFGTLGENLIKDVKDSVFRHLLELDVSFFESQKTGDLMAIILSDAYVVHSVFICNASAILRNLIMLAGSATLMLSIQPLLFMCLFILGGVLLVQLKYFGGKISDFSKKSRKQAGLISALTEEAMTGIHTINAEGAASHYVKKFELETTLQHDFIKKRVFYFGCNLCIKSVILFGGLFLILLVVYRLNFVSLSDQLGAFAYYALIASYSLSDLLETSGQMYGSSAAVERLRNLMETNPHIATPKHPSPLVTRERQIHFDNITFSYPVAAAQPLFQNFSLTIHSGERVALVGSSGSGKSTLFKLLLRLYDPVKGHVLLGDIPLTKISLEKLREQIGYLPQDPILFSGTIAENIHMHDVRASHRAIEHAAEQAYAMEFIHKLPEGLNTYVGEKGVRLSGGQKQRTVLARAILRNAPILLLDEPTSALDAQSEHCIQEALHTFLQKRTSLIVAHRLSTILDCDRILVLGQGQLVAEGSHCDLLKGCPLYARYAKRQLYAS